VLSQITLSLLNKGLLLLNKAFDRQSVKDGGELPVLPKSSRPAKKFTLIPELVSLAVTQFLKK
jgi:hypothetical protein